MCDAAHTNYIPTEYKSCENGVSVNVSALGLSGLKATCGCICNKPFTGGADYYDLRIFRNESITIAEACPVSENGILAVWIFCSVSIFIGIVLNFAFFFRYKRMYGGIRNWSFQFCFVITITGLFAMWVVSVIKAINHEDYVMGTHMGVTITYLLGVNFLSVSFMVVVYYMFQFVISLKRLEMPDEIFKKMLRRKRIFLFGNITCLLVMEVPIFLTLHSRENLAEKRIAFLSLGVVFMGSNMITALQAYFDTSMLVNQLQIAADAAKEAKEENSLAKFETLLSFAILSKKSAVRVMVTSLFSLILYAVFLAPILYPQQTFLFILGGLMALNVTSVRSMFLGSAIQKLNKRSSEAVITGMKNGINNNQHNPSSGNENKEGSSNFDMMLLTKRLYKRMKRDGSKKLNTLQEDDEEVEATSTRVKQRKGEVLHYNTAVSVVKDGSSV